MWTNAVQQKSFIPCHTAAWRYYFPFLTAEITLTVHNVAEVLTKNNFLRSWRNPFIGTAAAQVLTMNDAEQEHQKGINNRVLLFHTWAFGGFFTDSSRSVSADYFPQIWVSWTEKFWRQIWNNSDRTYRLTRKIQKPGRFICNNTSSVPLYSWLSTWLIL